MKKINNTDVCLKKIFQLELCILHYINLRPINKNTTLKLMLKLNKKLNLIQLKTIEKITFRTLP